METLLDPENGTKLATSLSALSPTVFLNLKPGSFYVNILSSDIAVGGEVVSGSFVTTPAPEPVSWAMILLGVGLVGGGLRMARRRGRSDLDPSLSNRVHPRVERPPQGGLSSFWETSRQAEKQTRQILRRVDFIRWRVSRKQTRPEGCPGVESGPPRQRNASRGQRPTGARVTCRDCQFHRDLRAGNVRLPGE